MANLCPPQMLSYYNSQDPSLMLREANGNSSPIAFGAAWVAPADRNNPNGIRPNPDKRKVLLVNCKTDKEIGMQPVLDGGYTPSEN